VTVTLNEVALRFLLEDEAGPTGRMLRRTADQIAGNYEFVVETIIPNPDIRPAVDAVVETGDLGLQASIGFPFEDRVSDYLADKIGDREKDRLMPVIMTAWDSQI